MRRKRWRRRAIASGSLTFLAFGGFVRDALYRVLMGGDRRTGVGPAMIGFCLALECTCMLYRGYIGSNHLASILPITLHMDVIPTLYWPTDNSICTRRGVADICLNRRPLILYIDMLHTNSALACIEPVIWIPLI